MGLAYLPDQLGVVLGVNVNVCYSKYASPIWERWFLPWHQLGDVDSELGSSTTMYMYKQEVAGNNSNIQDRLTFAEQS